MTSVTGTSKFSTLRTKLVGGALIALIVIGGAVAKEIRRIKANDVIDRNLESQAQSMIGMTLEGGDTIVAFKSRQGGKNRTFVYDTALTYDSMSSNISERKALLVKILREQGNCGVDSGVQNFVYQTKDRKIVPLTVTVADCLGVTSHKSVTTR